jgi:hypothetical protein
MAVSSLFLAWLLVAQVPPRLPDVVPINGHRFDIPITIRPETRPQIKSLQLFVSSDQGKTWNPTATGRPEQTKFVFNAPEDGVYWFTIVVVDQAGNQIPANPYTVPPSLIILVDTLKPVIKAFNADREGDDVVVTWEVQEDHPNLPSLRLEYRAQDAAAGSPWLTAPMISPLLKGETKFRPITSGAIVLRLSMKDSADNTGEKEFPLAAPVPVTPPPVAAQPPAPPAAPDRVASALIPGRESVSSAPPSPPPSPPPPSVLPPVTGPREIAVGGLPSNQPQPIQPVSMQSSVVPLPKPLVVNEQQISLEYDVRSGPSGLGRVELWITKDDGAHWEYLSDDPDLRSPITATLPGEGTYGLRLVVQSGAGLGEGPPQSGELPKLRVQVDLTPPLVRLYEPRPDQYQRDALVISWCASDPNLTPRPVKLEYAERAEGPWMPIAADLQAVGSHTWQMPKNVACRVFLRAIAADTAGNRTVAETREPVLIDLVKPEILGVRIGTRRAADAPATVDVPPHPPATAAPPQPERPAVVPVSGVAPAPKLDPVPPPSGNATASPQPEQPPVPPMSKDSSGTSPRSAGDPQVPTPASAGSGAAPPPSFPTLSPAGTP